MKDTAPLSLQTIVQQQPPEQVLVTEIGHELVMMNLETGSYISLNKTGRIIWLLIAEAIVIKDLIARLMLQFNVSEAECQADCLEHLNEMLQQKIIKVKPL